MKTIAPAHPDLSVELSFWQAGLNALAGLDEAGRGAWAGPVSAAAVILPPDPQILERLAGVRDSKQMTPQQREKWAEIIRAEVVASAVGFAGQAEIDQIGILPATRLAMRRALEQLAVAPQRLLIDALRLPEVDLPQMALVKGDARCLSIAAASVLAKTGRDSLLRDDDRSFPGYGFARHKGYGTAAHLAALRELGPCELHRRSFRPVKTLLAESTQEVDSESCA
jgi:ribonuclease HII